MNVAVTRDLARRAGIGALLLSASVCCGAGEIQRLNPEGLSKPQGYSQVVVASGKRWVHVAGQAGIGTDGKVPAGLEAQTRLMFEKVRIALAGAGATPADVVRIVVYIVDLQAVDPTPVYEGIRAFFPADAKPASSIVGVAALAVPGLAVEIDVTAAVDEP